MALTFSNPTYFLWLEFSCLLKIKLNLYKKTEKLGYILLTLQTDILFLSQHISYGIIIYKKHLSLFFKY